MVTLDEYSRLVSAIHAAAVTPRHWGEAVAAAGRAAGAAGGALIVTESRTRSVKSASIEPDALAAYSSHYYQVDYVLDAVERSPVGLIHSGQSLIALDARSEFNVDWMQPYEMDDGLFVRLANGAEPAVFLVVAPRRSDPFVTGDRVELVSALVPHLEQALRTQRYLDDLRGEADDAAEAIDSMRHPVFVVASDATVVQCNSPAEAMLRERPDGICVTGGRLRMQSGAADAELHRSISCAVGLPDRGRVGRSLLCPRPSRPRPLVVHVFPFTSRTRDSARPRALVIVVDPDCTPDPPKALLRRLFGLTATEADIAIRVAAGQGLTPIAEDLTLSMATVKTHVRHIFEKTDTHRQAELVRLLAALTP